MSLPPLFENLKEAQPVIDVEMGDEDHLNFIQILLVGGAEVLYDLLKRPFATVQKNAHVRNVQVVAANLLINAYILKQLAGVADGSQHVQESLFVLFEITP
jgi:hypothetical protein